jgi:hypothetical protein
LTWCCFWKQWPFFDSVMAVPRSPVPFTLKTAEFSVSALQNSSIAIRLGQHIYTYYTSVLYCGFFFRKHLEVPVRLFHAASISHWEWMELTSIRSNTASKQTLDGSTKSLHSPEVCSGCNSSINSWNVISVHKITIKRVIRCYVCLPLPVKLHFYTFLKKIPLLKPWSK